MAATPKTLIVGTLLTNALVSLYTVPANTTTRANAFIMTNHDTSARSVTLNIVESGDTAADKNEILDPTGYVLAPGEMRGIDLDQVITAGGFIQAMADVTSVVSLRVSGVEFT